MDDLDHHRPADPRATDDGLRYYLRKFQRHPGYRGASRVWRAVRKSPFNGWRLATHQFRELPSVVIVGAQKAGTTQLYEGLILHPACFGGIQKELNYFSSSPGRSLSWYRSRFSLTKTVRRMQGVCLEASPSYLPLPTALKRMRETLPDVKIIAILRDPVARAFSHYQHNKNRYRDSRKFAVAVREIIDAGLPGADTDSANVMPMLDYISRGYYALQIEALWQLFSREQTLILDSADLFDDTNAVCQRVFDFVGLQRRDVTVGKVFNRGYYREKIDPAIAEELRAHFRPHDERLADLLGQPFRWMQLHREAAQQAERAA